MNRKIDGSINRDIQRDMDIFTKYQYNEWIHAWYSNKNFQHVSYSLYCTLIGMYLVQVNSTLLKSLVYIIPFFTLYFKKNVLFFISKIFTID